VVFKTKTGTQLRSKGCNGSDPNIIRNRQCRVDLGNMRQNLKLDAGDVVQARVRSKNRQCRSAFSPYSVGPLLSVLPSAMGPVYTITTEEITDRSIHVHWDPMTDQSALGGPAAILDHYDLAAQPESFKVSGRWKIFNVGRKLEYTLSGDGQQGSVLASGKGYRMRVRAVNNFGAGVWSDWREFRTTGQVEADGDRRLTGN